ncbi:hypothetical protein ACHAWF_004901 [Thalassiosira exigua]
MTPGRWEFATSAGAVATTARGRMDRLFALAANRHLHETNRTGYDENYTFYQPEPYVPPGPIVRTHLLPRFGFPKDVGVMWEGDLDQVQTYVVGVCLGSMVILGVILAFLIVLAILRCVGYRRVGFLTGRFEYDVVEDVEDESRAEEKCHDGDDDVNGADVNDDCRPKVNDSTNETSTGAIMEVRTIGCGVFQERADHVSVVVNKAKAHDVNAGISEAVLADDNEQVCSNLANGIATGEETLIQTGSKTECSEGGALDLEEESVAIPKTNETLIETGKSTVRSQRASRPTKPTLKGFRLHVKRVGPDGKVIDLKPRPVPQELYWKVRVVRILFIAVGIGAMVSAGMFYSLGVQKFRQSMVDTRSGITVSAVLLCPLVSVFHIPINRLPHVVGVLMGSTPQRLNELGVKSIIVTDNLLDVQQQVEEGFEITDKALEVIITNCSLTSLAAAVNFTVHYTAIKNQVSAMNSRTKGILNGFRENMQNILSATQWFYDQTYKANIVFAIMVLLMSIMISLIVVMIVGVAFAAYEIENCFTRFVRRVILLPIFVLQVFLATLFSAIFFTIALAGSDFCVAPDNQAKGLLSSVAAGTDDSLSPLFTLMLFYLSGCKTINDMSVAQTIRNMVDGADRVLALAHDMVEMINTLKPQDVLAACNIHEEWIGRFDNLGSTLHNVTHQLHDSLDATLHIISCESVYPVYSDLVHNGVCNAQHFATLIACHYSLKTTLLFKLGSCLHRGRWWNCSNILHRAGDRCFINVDAGLACGYASNSTVPVSSAGV